MKYSYVRRLNNLKLKLMQERNLSVLNAIFAWRA